MNRVLDWPVNRPRAALILALLITLLSIWAVVFRLRPETSFQALLDRSDPAVSALGDVLENFPVVNELLVLATLPDARPKSASGAEDAESGRARLLGFARRLVGAIQRDSEARSLVADCRYQPGPQWNQFVERVVLPNALYYLDDEGLNEARARLTPEGMRRQLARGQQMLALPGPAAGTLARLLAADPLRLHEFLMRQTARIANPGAPTERASHESGLADPLTRSSTDGFFSPDQHSLLVRIAGVRSPNDFNFAQQLVASVDRLARAEAAQDGLRLDIAGGYAVSAHSAAMIRSDSISDVVSTVVGLALLFAVACRRPVRLFHFAFGPVALGILWGFGAFALFQRTITPLAAVVGGTLGAIGLDYTIHFITHLQHLRSELPDAPHAVRRTSGEMFLPSLAAWLTSVFGFAAVAISPVRVLRDFAVLGTLCLIGAWLATLFVLPALLVMFPVGGNHGSARATGETFAIRFELAAWIGAWIRRRARGLLAISCVILGLTAAYLVLGGVRLRVDSDPTVLHPQPSAPLQAERTIARRMGTSGGSLILHLRADSPEALLRLAHDVAHRLSQPTIERAGIVSTFGLSSLLPDPDRSAVRRARLDPSEGDRVERDLRAALDEAGFRADAFEDYIAFLRRLLAPNEPPGIESLLGFPELSQLLLPRDVLDGRAKATRAVTMLFTRGPLELREDREAALSAVRSAVEGMSGVTVTGTAAIGRNLELAVHRDLPRFVIAAMVLIGGYLLVHFRSWRLAALALLPIGVSLVFVCAAITYFDVRLSILHTVMAPLLLGINLDYGIFAVHAWRGSSHQAELDHHFPASFAALLICGGSTLVGFGSLMFTSVPAVESLGWLVNVGVGTCVLGTLFVLWPAMMVARQRARRREG